jgi:membrane protease YdiL (CAAX protease family)
VPERHYWNGNYEEGSMRIIRASAATNSYLLWTFGATWLIWIPVALLPLGQPTWLVPIVVFGAFMPSVMGIVFGAVRADTAERQDYWQRLLDPKRIPARYWAFILLLAPTLNLIGYQASKALGGPEFELDPASFGDPVTLSLFLLFTLISGPLAEELGWRGLLLPDLLGRHSAVKATLLVGLIWVVWHLPLFYIEGTPQAAQGLFTVRGVQWIIEVLALSVIVSWLFIRTRMSTLGAVMIHFMDNLAFSTFAGADYEREAVAGMVVTSLYVFVAIILLIAFRDLWFQAKVASAAADATSPP